MKLSGTLIISTAMCLIKGQFNRTIQENVFNYISTYNDIRVTSVVVVANQFGCKGDSIVPYFNISEVLSLQSKFYACLFLENGIDRLEKLLDKQNSALIIVFENPLVKTFKNILIGLSAKYFIDNSWIFVMVSESGSEKLSNMVTQRLEFVNKLGINSHVYASLYVDNKLTLVEVFKKCNQQPPVMQPLITVSKEKVRNRMIANFQKYLVLSSD